MRQWIVALVGLIAASALAAEPTAKDELLIEAGPFNAYKALLMSPPDPKALAVLLVGGSGDLQLRGSDGKVEAGPLGANFLYRSRGLFFVLDVAVLIVDSPGSKPMKYADRAASISYIKPLVEKAIERVPNLKALPIWGVATSAGTITLASLIEYSPDLFSGAVFTASVTNGRASSGPWSDANPRGIATRNYGFKKPVLVVAASDDACPETPPDDSEFLLSQFEASSRTRGMIIESAGGTGDPCQAASAHGFRDIEDVAVAHIAAFMLTAH